jgi:hypothetical protein
VPFSATELTTHLLVGQIVSAAEVLEPVPTFVA